MAKSIARLARNGALGRLRWKTTVESFAASTPPTMSSIDIDDQYVYGPPTEWNGCAGVLLRWRSIENTTAAALNGVPSWKRTPWRRWKVYVLPSGEISHEVASSGTT